MTKQVDKLLEQRRYSDRATAILSADVAFEYSTIPAYFAQPYEHFYRLQQALCVEGATVLEIGVGTGQHSAWMKTASCDVVAMDISQSALQLMRKMGGDGLNHCFFVGGDMENLPFADGSFDLLCAVGSLSYGDNELVLAEIIRVLKPGGSIVILDSLHHNPFFVLQRKILCWQGERTLHTLKNMPRMALLNQYETCFDNVEISFFGGAAWLVPILRHLMPEHLIRTLLDMIDRIFGVKKMAFKFVMVARKTLS